jgi:hypothetical protein
MSDEPTPQPVDPVLESWKAIAAYLNRDARTVMRWEKFEGLPLPAEGHGSVPVIAPVGEPQCAVGVRCIAARCGLLLSGRETAVHQRGRARRPLRRPDRNAGSAVYCNEPQG